MRQYITNLVKHIKSKVQPNKEETKVMLDIIEKQFKAMWKIDTFWFDGSKKHNENLSCATCSMGLYKTNAPSRHDYDCVIELSHQALLETTDLMKRVTSVKPTQRKLTGKKIKWLIILLTLMPLNLRAADLMKINAGLEYEIGEGYNDRIASIDTSYLFNYKSNFTYGLSAGFLRLSDFTTPLDSQGKREVIEGFNTLYGCGRVGVSIRPFKFIYADLLTGPCYFDKAKVLISGNLQFNTEIGYGLRDPKTGSTIGITIKHFSNAGIKKPNTGINLYMLSMGIALD